MDKVNATRDETLSRYPHLKPSDVAETVYMGYDLPMDLAHAGIPSYAFDGAEGLADFQAGMRASHNDLATGGPSTNTLFGSSAGSTISGAAALNGNHLDVDNFVAVGPLGPG